MDIKVLYVEDSMMMRKMTHKMLLTFFDLVDVANDGKEAYDIYIKHYENTQEFYDIVITDLEMPIMDGEQLSKKVLEYNHTQEIIVISSVGEFEKLVNLMNLGVNKFISKPIATEQLTKVIEQVTQDIHIKRLQEEEKLEVQEYNRVLKIKEQEQEKSLKAKQKEIEEFNQALIDSAIITKTDVNGVMTYVNAEMVKISGYTKEELVGNNSSMMGSGNRPKASFKNLWDTISNKNIYKVLFENKAKDGSIFYIETTINPIIDINNEIVEYIAVSHDMTQLMNTLSEVKQAKQAKEDFFINISHEMKTPLNSILGFSSLLKKRVADDAKSLLMVNTIYETGNDLNKLIESIIDIRKIQEHSLELKELSFNPKTELSKCINDYVKRTFEKNQKYNSFIDDNLPTSLIGDSTRITQVIAIVIDNAVKFTDEGGQIDVAVDYDEQTQCLICQVKDNGEGIAKQDHEKIFTLQQLDANANRLHEGAGLGLNIAHNLMEVMNGKILLKSIPQKGSVFKLEFPLHG